MSETHVRRRRKRMSEMNVVPYIDVMLVLLIIFMITAPMMNLGVEVDLPVGAAEPLTDRGDPLLVSVTSNGDFFLDTGDSPQLVDGETLAMIVGAIVERNPQVQVTVSGDRDVPYQFIFNAMVQLQRAGVPSVGLMGDPE
ncbi:MAG: ExbD/TolR family protein [Wenzhouxiangella sp.]